MKSSRTCFLILLTTLGTLFGCSESPHRSAETESPSQFVSVVASETTSVLAPATEFTVPAAQSNPSLQRGSEVGAGAKSMANQAASIKIDPPMAVAIDQLRSVQRSGSPAERQSVSRQLKSYFAKSLRQPSSSASAKALAEHLRTELAGTEFGAVAETHLLTRDFASAPQVDQAFLQRLAEFADNYPDSDAPVDFCCKVADWLVDHDRMGVAIGFLSAVSTALDGQPNIGLVRGKVDFLQRGRGLRRSDGFFADVARPRRSTPTRKESLTAGHPVYGRLVGKSMQLSGRTLDGTTISSRGRWTVGVFWATWCGACRSQLPAVEGVHRQFASRDVAVIGINLDEDLTQVKSYVSEKNISWPQIFNGDAHAQKYGISSIPAVVLIDAQGVVAEAGLTPASIHGHIRHHLQ